MFFKSMTKLSYGLFVITAKDVGKMNGCVVNTVMQLSSDPVMASVCINKQNLTHDMIKKSGIFNVIVLSTETSMDTIANFGFKSGKDADKFFKTDYELTENALPFFNDKCICIISLKVENSVDVGTHTLFIAKVVGERIFSESLEPMTYDYYKSVKNGSAPPAAPTYSKENTPPAKGYRCTICGYVYEGEALPDDFVCPICKHGAEVFEKL